MSPADFRAQHGDCAEWCAPEIDEYLDLCDDARTPTVIEDTSAPSAV